MCVNTELQTRKERLCSKLLGSVVDMKLFQKKSGAGSGLERAEFSEEGRVAVEVPFRGALPEQRPDKLRSGKTAKSSPKCRGTKSCERRGGSKR